ncbi:MAG: penicillin acylase family protein, partial [Chlorobi bacterium]|nr:penicillin acylase family protein [Chlorobiota bacterium]
MKKTIFIIIAVLLLVSIIAYFFIKTIASSALPDYNETTKLKGLKDEVKVYRDEFGVPHIVAKNDDDLYRVTGYIIAQDRMWQMDLLRRVTQGRLSEIFGNKTIGADKLFRALRISEKSEMVLSKTDAEIIKALEAFSDGVNQYIEKGDLSFEFKVLGYKPEKWTPQHSINLVGYMAWDLAIAWKMEMPMYKMQQKLDKDVFNEIFENLAYQKDVVYPEFMKDSSLTAYNLINEYEKVKDIIPEIFNGSNNWVVSGKKSTTGKPIFANDMHLGLMIPGVWSQIHQYVEGKVNVTGVVLPGSPFVVAGHNEKIAWGMTNLMLDGMDFYVETVNEDSTKYKLNGEWKNFKVKNEKINIKGEESVDAKIRFTHRGPVISEFKNTEKVISCHWIGNEMSNEIRSLYLLNRANNWNEFRDAVSTFKAVAQNIAYADVEGNIGLQCCAGVPVRVTDGDVVFPGDTDKYDWKGLHPFEELPFSYNPECGYVYSANNRTTSIDSFYISAWYALPNRANRIK